MPGPVIGLCIVAGIWTLGILAMWFVGRVEVKGRGGVKVGHSVTVPKVQTRAGYITAKTSSQDVWRP